MPHNFCLQDFTPIPMPLQPFLVRFQIKVSVVKLQGYYVIQNSKLKANFYQTVVEIVNQVLTFQKDNIKLPNSVAIVSASASIQELFCHNRNL